MGGLDEVRLGRSGRGLDNERGMGTVGRDSSAGK